MSRPRRKSKLAQLGFFTPIDYAKWIQREHWWTWELVSLVSCDYREPPKSPDHSLAYHFDNAPTAKDHEGKEVRYVLDPADLLEEELRRETDAKNLTPREDERRSDGHRLLKAGEGLTFVLKQMGAINSKIKLAHESERIERKRTNDRRKRVIAVNKRVRRRNTRLYKKHSEDPSGPVPIYLRQVHDYSLHYRTKVRKRWKPIVPKLPKLFIPDELKCLLDETRTESLAVPVGEKVAQHAALEWSDVSFRLNGKRDRHRLWVKFRDGAWNEANHITLGIRPPKNKAPSRQWEVFISIVEGAGLLPNADKRIVFSLNESLCKWSGIKCNPIFFDAGAGGHRSLFKVCEPAREREPTTEKYDPERKSHNPRRDSADEEE